MGNGTQWHKGAEEDGAPWGNWVQRGIGDRGVVGNEKKDAVENRVRSAGGGTRRGEVEEQDTVREHYLGRVFDVACVLFLFFSPCGAGGGFGVWTRCWRRMSER
jgi:hypothetical protein